jgi:hypothetical protein
MADIDSKSPARAYAQRTSEPKPNIAYPGTASGYSKAQAQNIAKDHLDNSPPKASHVTNATPTIAGDA